MNRTSSQFSHLNSLNLTNWSKVLFILLSNSILNDKILIQYERIFLRLANDLSAIKALFISTRFMTTWPLILTQCAAEASVNFKRMTLIWWMLS